MIIRPPQHWFLRLFVWHGSVLTNIRGRLLFILLISIGVLFLEPFYDATGVSISSTQFGIIGVAISIFLGFRNNACYSRYVEARMLWGQLLIAARDLTRESKTLFAGEPQKVAHLINLQIGFAHALRLTLRRLPDEGVLARYLSPDELKQVQSSRAPCSRILLLMGEWLAVQRTQGLLSDILYRHLDDQVNRFSHVLASCERIMNTPVPFAYSLILHRTVYLFCILFPFTLVSSLHYLTPLVSVFTAYTFIALDSLAEELEEPFGFDDNDLPLDALCNVLEIDLREMNDDPNKPALLTAQNYRLT